MSNTASRLEGKRALITGGTRGIGLAIAEQFGQEGASVVIAGTENGRGEEAAVELRSKGYNVLFEPVDMAKVGSVQQMVGRAALHLGGIDTLVNNAGVGHVSSIKRLTEADWDRVSDVNLKGAVFCMQAVHAYMAPQKSGSIINISSIAALDGDRGLAAYAASKGGLISATYVASKEFAAQDIRVNAIAAGVVETDMIAGFSEEQKAAITSRVPLGRLGSPADVASMCTFLASDEASYMTGQVLRIDGGLHF